MYIGIITPYDAANYGAYLQAYATKRFLESQGHSVLFVRWRTEEERKKFYFKKGIGIKQKIKLLLRGKHNQNNFDKMTLALNEFDIVDANQMSQINLDLLILGSDEIWNIKVPEFQNEIFYGGNCGEIKTLAYAPSASEASVEDFENFPQMYDLLKKIKIIGVRDENTAGIVKAICGYEPEIVCDPTFLLGIEEYKAKEQLYVTEQYLLVYSYFVEPQIRKYLIKFAKENNLKLVAACMYQSWCNENVCCEPLEFISLIKNAQYVFTTTFHGSIFTLFQHKKCAIRAKSKKLRDLIKWTGMGSTVIQEGISYDEFCKVMEKQHDYNAFEQNLSEKRKKSQELYKKYLKM